MGSMQKTWKAQENTKLGGWIKLPKQREREKGTQTEADKQDRSCHKDRHRFWECVLALGFEGP